jgi:hypothetical protein
MKQITMNIRPIEEAVKNDQVKLSWQDGRAVLIGWRKKTKIEYYNEPWYKLGVPGSREVDDGSEWYFIRFNPRTAKYELDAPCGLFIPEVFAELPLLCHAKEIEQ